MSMSIERREKPNGLTHKDLVVQFIKMRTALKLVMFQTSEMREKRNLLVESLATHFWQTVSEETLEPVDPFADFRGEVDFTIAEKVKKLITGPKGKSRWVPGCVIHETSMYGLYLFEEFPNQVERRVYLVGSNERSKRFLMGK